MSDSSLTAVTNDILIVGAGPVGLTLVNDLLRRGIRSRIIDSAEHPEQKTKALGIHAKTLELLAKMGVVQTAIERGLKSPVFSLYSDGKRIARIDFREHLLDSPYPYVLMLPQHETERLLTEHLQSQGGAIEWQTELISVSQDEQGVQEMVEAYLVIEKAASGLEQEAGYILLDETGELHQRYEAEHGGLLLIRPDGYIGFWGPFGATEALRVYVQKLFVPENV